MSRYTPFIVVILFTAAIFRFVGLTPGYHPYHPDESAIHSTAVDFIKNGNFKPGRYEYPPLPAYINYAFFKFLFVPAGWAKFGILNITKILDGQIKFPLGKDVYDKTLQLEILGHQDVNSLYWTRGVTALFGVGVVFASYLVGGELFGRGVGLVTALLVSVNFRQVLNSHFGLPDIYNAFFFLFSFWAILSLRKKINAKRSLLVGVLLGLYLSTKYQFFPFITLFLVFLERMWQEKSLKAKLLFFLNPLFVVIPIVSLFVFLILNPYLFINFTQALKEISYAALKYGAGTMHLTPYSYWYLFNFGLGKITSILVLFGIVISLFREKFKTLLLLGVILPFFFFLTFYSSGGFYTRNFISITPFLLILAGYSIFKLLNFKPKIFFLPIALFILGLAVWENLANSLIVIKEYSQPWNRTLVGNWLSRNTPENAIIAAHPSVPIPGTRVRIDYDRFPWPNFSLAEFAENGASFAVTNLDWMDSDFYGWMRTGNGWTKPLKEMKNSYVAMTINELTDFGLYEAINPWQAPDSDFIVAKVPRYTATTKSVLQEFSFDTAKDMVYWQSEPIKIEGQNGFEVKYKMKMDTGGKASKDGFIFAKFYLSYNDALRGEDYNAIRLSSRDDKPGIWVDKSLIGKIPAGNGYLVLGFSVYDKNLAKYYLDKIYLYNADVSEDLGGENIRKIKIDENVLFPNSHGNL